MFYHITTLSFELQLVVCGRVSGMSFTICKREYLLIQTNEPAKSSWSLVHFVEKWFQGTSSLNQCMCVNGALAVVLNSFAMGGSELNGSDAQLVSGNNIVATSCTVTSSPIIQLAAP